MLAELIEKLTNDCLARISDVERTLTQNADWKILHDVLEMDEMSCYKLFRRTNSALADVEFLISMLSNCLHDDGSLAVILDLSHSGFPQLYVSWGHDDLPRVSEKDLFILIRILKDQSSFYVANKAEIDNLNIKDRFILLDVYYDFTREFERQLYSLASKEIQKKYDKLKIQNMV